MNDTDIATTPSLRPKTIVKDATLEMISKPFNEIPTRSGSVVTHLNKILRQFNRSLEPKKEKTKKIDVTGETTTTMPSPTPDNFDTSSFTNEIVWRLYQHYEGKDAFYGKPSPISSLRLAMIDSRCKCEPTNVMFILDEIQCAFNRCTTQHLGKSIFSEEELSFLKEHSEKFGESSPPFKALIESGFKPEFLTSLKPRKKIVVVTPGKAIKTVTQQLEGSDGEEDEDEDEPDDEPTTSDDEFVDKTKTFNSHILPDDDDDEEDEDDDEVTIESDSDVEIPHKKHRHDDESRKRKYDDDKTALISALAKTLETSLVDSIIVNMKKARKITRSQLISPTCETSRQLASIAVLLASMKN